MIKTKIAIIGAGQIGGTIAHLALKAGLSSEIVLFDIVEGLAKGKALDLSQCAPLEGRDVSIIGTSRYADIAGANVVIITAGLPRKPGMSRDDLLITNGKIVEAVGVEIKNHCPKAFVVCITNPLDAMVHVLHKACQVPDHMIVGMAGVLDSARFCSFIAEEFKVSTRDVHAYVLGGHGDNMVPLVNLSNVAGVSLAELVKNGSLPLARLEAIVQRVRDGGGEIVELLQNGSAFYTPATAALTMAEAYLLNKNRILPCAAKLNGQYSIQDGIFMGVPVKINASGIAQIIEVPLTNAEHKELMTSAAKVRELNNILAKAKAN